MGNICSVSVSCDAILSRCQDWTTRRSALLCDLEDSILALQSETQKLIEARNDLMTRVVIAEQQHMKRLNQVEGWLSRVQAVEIEVGKLIRDSPEQIEKLCLGGFCSKNCMSSYKFGKKVARVRQDVSNLREEGDFEDVAERIPDAVVEERPIEPTVVGLQSILYKVWECLGEEQVGIIGLYGMGGVGKTTLLTQINNKFLDVPNDFEVVIWVVVSKDLQLEKIQESIGRKIGLSDDAWTNKSPEEKALDVFKILSKKKFVLLMDDVWERVDLAKVGVPPPSSKIKSKVVFTTRFIEQRWGKELLPVILIFLNLAQIVVKECGGLPLALITIGRAMTYKKRPEEWNYVIQALRTRSTSGFSGMEKEVYPLLKFSYDNLPSDTARSCFLYCSLFPEDYSIFKNDLIECWIGEGFLDTYHKRGAQNQGYYIIGVLLHACLLEEEDEDYVKMHDVIRDMALWIACEIQREKENFLVHSGAQLTEIPESRKWEGVKRMSLMENKIQNLSESPKCPHLITLFLNSNSLRTISCSFFQFMPSLKVLNLSNNRSLTELPSGVSKLVSLEYLDLSRTAIKKLSKELEFLVNLKCLKLESTFYLHTIPRQLISNFSWLRVLRMFSRGSLRQVPEDSVLFGGSDILVEELLCLKHLNVLTLTLKSFHALQRVLSSSMLQSCTQSLCLQYLDDYSKSLNILSLASMRHLDTFYILDCEFLEDLEIPVGEVQRIIRIPHVFHSLHIVEFSYCLKLRDLTWLIFAPQLKYIHVSRCPNMEEIIKAGKLDEVEQMMMGNPNPFAKLQVLQLELLLNLKSIYPSPLPLPDLKEIHVHGCPKLKKLPLDSNSAKEHKLVIKGQKNWWEQLQWEDLETQNLFNSSFNLY
ncbi:NBS-LRR type disease resistance protein [Melia azedarach]|uniref:NBS-LRR type disease resistance protein n=1 Tax=Melia azedarach TaxID=155640 RepID=A0ACC1Y592_MELAZ|nr:NBS-LRR type disease resistance protein [Melia azedarach]